MRKSKVHYQSHRHFEAMVCQAALLLLTKYEPRADRDDSLHRERPKRWPLTEQDLRMPSGKREKCFTGLTYEPREFLKSARINGPSEVLFGLKVLAWYHREVWQGFRDPQHVAYGEYMRWFLTNEERIEARLPPDELAMLRGLYGIAPETGQLEDTKAVA